MSDMQGEVIDNNTQPTDDEKLMAMLIFLIGIFTHVIGPIIIWLIKRDDSPYVDYYGKEYLNFLISFTIYGFVAGILILAVIGVILLPAVGITAFVFIIMGAVKAYSGEKWKVPLIFRLIK